jgi:alpha-glucoside transport system permease protein
MSVRSPFWPSIDPVAAIAGLIAGGLLGYLAWILRRRKGVVAPHLLLGLAIGWLVGAWLAADFAVAVTEDGVLAGATVGTQAEAIIVAVVLGLLAGGWVGSVPYPDDMTRTSLAAGSRKYIFLVPALLFVIGTLVIPLGRTIWLGFLTGSPRNLEWTGLTNYGDILTDPGIIDLSDWTSMFSSRLFWGAILLIVLGVALGRWLGRSSGSGLGTGFSLTAGTVMLIVGGMVLLGFSVFVAIRGTIPNNLWWIFSVIAFAVTLGLGVAVLADRSKGENLAKSLIFLPMAISFVGASVIWRLMYIARPPQDPQTGVFNTVWVQIGEWSNSDSASVIISTGLALIVVGLLYLAWRGWRAESNAMVAGSFALTVPLIFLIYRFLGPGIGGFTINEVTGDVMAAPVLFIQEAPWNNFWLMVVFIWIQTGFAMVIFSAAIKSVPEELLEAARIDGATESQTFWRVTVPQIYPTIGVVTTTLIVTVLKVFDIPKVMTNGNFDTQVLANEMWQKAFTELDFGVGSAVAVILFLGVLPVMYLNIRRMQKERLA